MKKTKFEFLGASWRFWVGAIAVYAVVQVLFSTNVITDYMKTVIQLGCVMTIVSLGLNLIYGFNGQFSLGQWGFYAIGAYASADITYRYAAKVSIPLNLGFATFDAGKIAIFLVAILFGALLAGVIAYLFGLPVLKLGSDYFGIATLGFTIVVKVLADNSDTILPFPEMKGARGMVGIPRLTTWFWSFFLLVLCILILRNILHSTTGRAIVSVRENEIAAKAMGIDTVKYKTLSFVIGGIYAGLAGGIYAHLYAFLHPSLFHFIKSFDPMIIIVFGGLGSITGTIAAAFAWAFSLEGLRIILPSGAEAWRYIIYPVALLLIMLLRPQGLLGGIEWGFLKPIQWPRRKIDTGAPTVETATQEAV
ncbi:MAG: branched-chain amino acid ABC transporter permease [Anaerolineae bacterium]